MNPIVFHIVSGQSFFSGIALVLLALVASTRPGGLWRRTSILSLVVGLIAIAVSSTAIPYGLYGLAFVLTMAWIVPRFRKAGRHGIAFAVAAVWLIAAAVELPYHMMSSLRTAPDSSITIIGDSMTAGLGGDETSVTWPDLLAEQHQLQVQDISHMGETAASALKRAKGHTINSAVILIEIGGNDLLGSTPSAQFGQDLDALLTFLKAPGRQLMMFELPLPPFCHEYGRVQRAVAAQHNVTLIPKRVLLSILAGGNSTLDSIHLSQEGHRTMAGQVWSLVKAAFDSK